VAAHLASEVEARWFGKWVEDFVKLPLPQLRSAPGALVGEVVYVDRFGNLVTNLEGAELHALLGPDPGVLEVRLGLHALRVVRTYAEVGEGRPCALIGSTGRLEVAVNRGRAADALGASLGTPVEVRRQA
jgi:S-adenosylmethionine hydrolase